MKIIVPMSGIGKRFINAGYKDPKPLIIVDNKTIIEHVCNLFPKENDYIFICNENHLKDTNMKAILKKIKPKSKIVSIKTHKFGPVYAVTKAFDLIKDDEEVIVSYCDYGTKWNYSKFLKTVRNKKSDGAIACYKGFHPHMLGSDNYAFAKEKNNLLIKIKEKEPFTKNKMQEFASNGTYYFRKGKFVKKYFKKIIDKKDSINNEYYVSLVYNLLVKDKLKVLIYEIQNMLQWGTPLDLQEYQKWSKYFKSKDIDKGKTIRQNKTINLLPMAGLGARFAKEGYKVPKPIISINQKPMFVRAMQALPKAKKNIFICKKKHVKKFTLEKKIKKHFNNYQIVTLDKHTSGQASTCEIALKNQNKSDSVLVGTCDSSIIYSAKKYQKLIDNNKNQIIVFSFRNSLSVSKKPNDYSFLKVDKKNDVYDVSEKKKISKKPYLDHAIVGIFYFRKIQYFFDGLKLLHKKNHKINHEFYLDSIIKLLAKKKYKIKVFEINFYIGWGTPNDLRVFNYWKKYFSKN